MSAGVSLWAVWAILPGEVPIVAIPVLLGVGGLAGAAVAHARLAAILDARLDARMDVWRGRHEQFRNNVDDLTSRADRAFRVSAPNFPGIQTWRNLRGDQLRRFAGAMTAWEEAQELSRPATFHKLRREISSFFNDLADDCRDYPGLEEKFARSRVLHRQGYEVLELINVLDKVTAQGIPNRTYGQVAPYWPILLRLRRDHQGDGP